MNFSFILPIGGNAFICLNPCGGWGGCGGWGNCGSWGGCGPWNRCGCGWGPWNRCGGRGNRCC